MQKKANVSRQWFLVPLTRWTPVVVWSVLLGLFGCDGLGKERGVHLDGAVTIDQVPVEKGTISFVPAKGAAIVAEIGQGRFTANVPEGPVRVMFQATRETGRQVKMYNIPTPEVVNLIPPAYQAGIDYQVVAEQTEANFSLQSK